ncbi:GNAT family N-acetyltransferase [Oceanomicrobium pacificus]|uniref:GNAT family N-acetyltransferase n=1 Tax=Oceanomicrobium pacificus TaxID=2692916 RepID=A0A6B0TNQ2_9RHOB|nr:GNAT family N-acetyltransferase [Oceanomicrobium pacificus]MXU66240.1 GNAT family N-acetyltransferase [Oceanomicrobium pacificus]
MAEMSAITDGDVALRPIRGADFEPMHAMASEDRVARMTATWPVPADPAFTLMRMNTAEAQAGLVRVITWQGAFAGTIGLVGSHLGYMLTPALWGRGIATRAVRAMVDDRFRHSSMQRVEASVWTDNPASARVLEKAGFTQSGESSGFCAARDEEVAGRDFTLTREDWAAALPLDLSSDRIRIRPLGASDADAFHAFARLPEVARNMVSFPAPMDRDAAAAYLADRPFRGRPGFCAAITARDGGLVGICGIGGTPMHLMYALAPDAWGQGLATEAMQLFLPEMVRRFQITELIAGAFADNPASSAVLAKLGFESDGARMAEAPARVEPAQLLLYRLSGATLAHLRTDR